MDFIKGFIHMKGLTKFIGHRALLTREGDVFLCSGWDILTLIALDGKLQNKDYVLRSPDVCTHYMQLYGEVMFGSCCNDSLCSVRSLLLVFLPYFYTEKQGKPCSNMANVNKKVYICECSLEYTSKCTQSWCSSWSVWSNCNKYIPIYYQIQPFNGHAIYKTKHIWLYNFL